MTNKPQIRVKENGNLHIHIPMMLKRVRGRKLVIAPEALDGEIPMAKKTKESPVIQAIVRAFSWAEALEAGEVMTIAELAKNLEVDGSYVSRILRLTNLAPDIIEAVLNGEEPSGLSLAKLTRDFPMDWEEQREVFGFL